MCAYNNTHKLRVIRIPRAALAALVSVSSKRIIDFWTSDFTHGNSPRDFIFAIRVPFRNAELFARRKKRTITIKTCYTLSMNVEKDVYFVGQHEIPDPTRRSNSSLLSGRAPDFKTDLLSIISRHDIVINSTLNGVTRTFVTYFVLVRARGDRWTAQIRDRKLMAYSVITLSRNIAFASVIVLQFKLHCVADQGSDADDFCILFATS